MTQGNIDLTFVIFLGPSSTFKMMEVENRIETFGGQVDDLPDELRDRRRISGGSGDNGVILEEDEDSRDGDIGLELQEKSLADGTTSAVGGRVIKKVSQITDSILYILTLSTITSVLNSIELHLSSCP